MIGLPALPGISRGSLGLSRGGIALALGAGAGQVAAQIAIPLATGFLVDAGLLARDGRALGVGCLLLIGAALASVVFRGIQQLAVAQLTERGRAALLAELTARLLRRPRGAGDAASVGELQSLLTEDATVAARNAGQLFSEASLGALQLVGLLGVLGWRYGALAGVGLVLVPIYALFPLALARPLRRAASAVFGATGATQGALAETLRGARDLRLLACEAWAVDQLRRRLGVEADARLREVALQALYGLEYAIYFLVGGALYWFGGQRVLAGELSVGQLVALVPLLAYLEGPVARLAQAGGELQRLRAAAERLASALGPEADAAEGDLELPAGTPRLHCEGLSLRHGEDTVLHAVSATIQPGELVALVGASGAGKSSLAGLLARLHPPSAGQVRLGEQPLERLRTASLYRAVALVHQDARLFAGTLEDNLRLGEPAFARAELLATLETLGFSSLLDELPDGLETEVGEGGSRLSGGQRQRVALARAVLRRPRMLILDEATSALDSRAEVEAVARLRAALPASTVILVSHRPSCFLRADRLLLLERGRLLAQGPPAELERTVPALAALCVPRPEPLAA
jgi:ATP-binding cassette, subfamily B, bacterial